MQRRTSVGYPYCIAIHLSLDTGFETNDYTGELSALLAFDLGCLEDLLVLVIRLISTFWLVKG